MEHSRASGISHISATAALSVVALLGVGIWQTVHMFESRNAATTYVASTPLQSNTTADTALAALEASTTDPITAVSTDAVAELVGAYAGLQQQGEYSTTSATEIGGTIGKSLNAPISYETFTSANIQTGSDTSYASMMKYRAALQTSLKPLLVNTEPEYEIFGLYVQTKEEKYLEELRADANTYRAVASSSAEISVPADAVNVHLGLLNSMEEFAATLDTLADHANDPIASSVLLENYDQAESDVLNAFQALVTYEQSKTQ